MVHFNKSSVELRFQQEAQRAAKQAQKEAAGAGKKGAEAGKKGGDGQVQGGKKPDSAGTLTNSVLSLGRKNRFCSVPLLCNVARKRCTECTNRLHR